jgi:4,5-DOPA dioxygenase extradiol
MLVRYAEGRRRQFVNNESRMPVVFFGHGSPTNVLEDNEATRAWHEIALAMPEPRAVLCVSAHWCTDGTAVTAMSSPRTIHDFGRSLPAPLFDCQYPAPGQPELAARVAQLLETTTVTLDQSWGLDHGAWSVLSKAWPEANIPVVQLSIDQSLPDRSHFDIGKQLIPLRDEGILIAGSGNIVHNLGVMEWNEQATPYDWAIRFNDYVKDCIKGGDMERLYAYPELGNDARLALPGLDHFWPLFYVLGARDDDPVGFATDFIQYKSLSMTSIIFGGA